MFMGIEISFAPASLFRVGARSFRAPQRSASLAVYFIQLRSQALRCIENTVALGLGNWRGAVSLLACNAECREARSSLCEAQPRRGEAVGRRRGNMALQLHSRS